MKKIKSIWAIGTSLLAAVVLQTSCSGGNGNAEITQLKEETIAIHDEIMPQISSFDRQAVKIDSILFSLDSLKELNETLDTAQIRTDLTQLKYRLEGATDQMMQWMMEFDGDPQDKTEEEIKAYYQSELDKVKQMKTLFEDVTKESAEKLANF